MASQERYNSMNERASMDAVYRDRLNQKAKKEAVKRVTVADLARVIGNGSGAGPRPKRTQAPPPQQPAPVQLVQMGPTYNEWRDSMSGTLLNVASKAAGSRAGGLKGELMRSHDINSILSRNVVDRVGYYIEGYDSLVLLATVAAKAAEFLTAQ